MNIVLNDKPVNIEEKISLQGLFQKLNIKAATGVAVAVNEMIIPREDEIDESLKMEVRENRNRKLVRIILLQEKPITKSLNK